MRDAVKRYFPVLLLVVIAFSVWDQRNSAPQIREVTGGSDYEVERDPEVVGASDRALADAFRNHTSNLQIEGAGKVVKVQL